MSETLLDQLRAIQSRRALAQQPRYRRSRLDRFRAEILDLHEMGASLEEIRVWLQWYQHTKVHSTTISRAITRWRQRET